MSTLETELLRLRYDKSAGPLHPKIVEIGILPAGEAVNCQRAIQLLYRYIFGVTLTPNEVLSKESYLHSGYFVARTPDPTFFEKLAFGDLIYAWPHWRRRKGELKLEDLHRAVYMGVPSNPKVVEYFPNETQCFVPHQQLIFHATPYVPRATTIWDSDKFMQFYELVAAKRIL